MKKRFLGLAVLIFFCLPFIGHTQELYKSIDGAHDGDAVSAVISNDGEMILTGGTDTRAYLWDTKTGDKIKILAHSETVQDVDFNANGKLFITASGQRLITFDSKEGKPQLLLKDHEDEALSVAFNPINENIASGSKNGDILIWNKNASLLHTLKQHDKAVNAIAYSPDGKNITTGSDDNTVRIWDASSGQLKHTIEADQKSVLDVSYSADAAYIASAGKNGSVKVWNAHSGNKVFESAHLSKEVYSVTFSPDVQYLAAAGDDNKIVIWDMNTRQVKHELTAHEDGIRAIDFDDEGQYMISVGGEGTLKVWDVKELDIGKKKFVKTSSAKPKLVCSPLKVDDANDNGIIETNEKPNLTFTITNKGEGKAYDVTAKVSLEEHVKGLDYTKKVNIGNLGEHAEEEVTIPVETSEDLETTASAFIVSIEEANGHNPNPLRTNFQTKGTQHYSYVMVTGHKFSSSTGKAEVGAPITLKLKLKNTSKGVAKNVKVNYLLPEKVLAVDKLSETIPTLKPGEEKEIQMQFYADEGYSKPSINLGLTINGVAYTNASDIILKVDMNETLPGEEKYALADQEPPQPNYRGGGDMLKGLNVSKSKSMQIGKYYALIIGINNYSGQWTPLQNALNDAQAVEQILKTKYNFDKIITLYNDEATRENIIKKFEWLVDHISSKDNLLIYYSGHGEYKQALDKGYWVPIDATTKSTSEFISNSDIQTFLGGINSKHTLLVSDACFSGDIFRGNTISVPFEESKKYYREVHNRLSRQALTSGGIEPVMDGGQDGHSVFTYYFLKALTKNDKKYLTAGEIYNELKIPVVNNSEQSPKISPVKNTGDEGGQFLFVNKK